MPGTEVQPPAGRERRVRRQGGGLTRGPRGAELDAANRDLGRKGEEWVVAYERDKLNRAGHPDLAERVEWVADTQGDGLGYDVASFRSSGEEIWIEIKTTNLGINEPFVLTSNELEVSARDPGRYALYRVFDFSGSPRFFALYGRLDDNLELTPVQYRGRVK